MSAEEHAVSNIELIEVCATLGPVLDGLTRPVRWVVATGVNLGGGRDEMERMRASPAPVLARALFPQHFDDYLTLLEHRLDDPRFMALDKRCLEAAAWTPDDPRVEELATALADHLLAHPGIDAGSDATPGVG